MTPKNTLITGASRGLGRALAVERAQAGDHVIAFARTQGGLTELDDQIKKDTGKNATLVPFDLAGTGDSFGLLGQTLFGRFKKLDTLVLNAATIGPLSPVTHTLDKDWQKVMAVNLTATMRLLRVLDPMLRQAEKPLIIFVTCGAESMGKAYWGAYAASKKALEEIALSFEEETKNAGYRIRLFDPGPMATQLRRNAFPGEDQTKLMTPEQVALAMMGNAALWG